MNPPDRCQKFLVAQRGVDQSAGEIEFCIREGSHDEPTYQRGKVGFRNHARGACAVCFRVQLDQGPQRVLNLGGRHGIHLGIHHRAVRIESFVSRIGRRAILDQFHHLVEVSVLV